MNKGSAELEKEDWYVGEEEVTTHQEVRPLPLLCGTRKVALGWISPALDMITIEAPNETPGKK